MFAVFNQYRLSYEGNSLMDSIKNYLISVIAAAIISAIATGIVGKKGTVGAVIKLLAGLFLIITAIYPVTKLNFDALPDYFSEYSIQASAFSSKGEAIAQDEITAIIKSQVEAYILDKASLMNMEIEVQVTMSGSKPSIPESVTVKGTISPYGKKYLEQILCNDLDIAKENQFWT